MALHAKAIVCQAFLLIFFHFHSCWELDNQFEYTCYTLVMFQNIFIYYNLLLEMREYIDGVTYVLQLAWICT